jgi:hypothetical protein
VAEYARILEEKIIQHKLIKRAGKAHTKSRSKRSITWQLNKLDKELGQYMRYAEKNCRKIKSGRIPFSPESSLLIRWTQVYRSLLKFHARRIQNQGNLKRSTQRCNIPDELSLLIQEIYYRLKACLSRCEYFRKNGHYYRRKHLYSRLEVAKEKDEEAAHQILAIIQREKDQRFWWWMTYDLGKPRGGGCFWVQVEQGDGTTEEYTGQEEMQEAIWDNIHRKRFHLAKLAPLCQEPLHGTFGYNAICQTSQEILNRMYEYPPEFDEATKEILQECALIRLKIPVSAIKMLITKNYWENHWGKAKEETSSSVSGRHFSHYKAGLCLAYISHLQSLFASLIVRRGIVLEHWSQGLSVMLEKIFGCALTTKLWSILLMEADFNAANKTIYGIRMLANVRK